MIQASELRIGNWLHYKVDYYHPTLEIQIKHDKFEQVDTIDYDHLLTDQLPDSYCINHNDRKNYYPIPLTPEILEKCGFKKWGRDDMPRTISYELGSMQFFPSNNFCDFEGYGFLHYKLPNPIDGKDESARFKFKYLHQLQNLFYSLCGEELQYKP